MCVEQRWCIELSGLQAALVEMNDSALTIDQLDALSRAVPDDQERKDIRLYLQVSALDCLVSGLSCICVSTYYAFILIHSSIHSFVPSFIRLFV